MTVPRTAGVLLGLGALLGSLGAASAAQAQGNGVAGSDADAVSVAGAVTNATGARADATGPSPELRVALIAELERASAADDLAPAIERFKQATERWPEDESLAIALAVAYERDGNELWATRTLLGFAERRLPACGARAVLAWLWFEQADLEAASESLREPRCAGAPPEVQARRALVQALVAEQRGDRATLVEALSRAREARVRYSEDARELARLAQRYDPGYRPRLAWELELGAGWTSNSLSGSPLDTQTRAARPSGVGELDLRLDATFRRDRSVRPTLGLGIHALELSAPSAREDGYQQLSLHPGLLLGRDTPRLALGYRAEALAIEGGDRYTGGPLWYSEAHGGEARVELTPQLIAYLSAGYRRMREQSRSRFELQQGVAWAHRIQRIAHGVLGLSGRAYRAEHRAYDQIGATLLGNLRLQLAERLELRQRLSVSFDRYPDSEGYFASAAGEERQEWLTQFTLGAFWQLGPGLALGGQLSRSERRSSARAYELRDDRISLRLTWSSNDERSRHRELGAASRASLRLGAETADPALEGPSVQQLLRQDEAVQRGGACLK